MSVSKMIAGASAIVLGVNLASAAMAGELITNGGFETGDYTGWTVNTQAGSSGSLNVVLNNGGTSPLSGFSYALNPAGGVYFSITDQTGPGSYSLTQSFTLLSSQKVTISFDLFANNNNGTDINNGRDYTINPNQNAVADLLVGGADPFTDAAADIVATLYGPGSDGAGVNPWQSYSSSLFLAAGTYTLRFAETDNQTFFQQGVDNVSVSTAPEPAAWAMMLVGFGVIGGGLRSRRRIGVSFG